MFAFIPSQPYRWPVHVQVPDPKQPGAFQTHTFHADFVALTEDETVAALGGDHAPARDMSILLGLAEKLDFNELLKRAVVGWDTDVVDAEGKAIPFSDHNLGMLLAWPPTRNAFLQAYIESASPAGAAARKRKN